MVGMLRAIPLHAGLSDKSLLALSDSYLSLRQLFFAGSMDEDYVRLEDIDAALDILYDITLSRCVAEQPLGRRCRMLAIMYAIAYMQMRVEAEECFERMCEATEEWMHGAEVSAESVYDVLRCISILYYDVPAEERASDAAYRRFKEYVGMWSSGMTAEGCWPGVSLEESLLRLEILSRNSTLLLDETNDAHIDRACRYCRGEVLRSLDRGDVPEDGGYKLFMLYDNLGRVSSGADMDELESVAEMAFGLLERYLHGSDGWMLCLAVGIGWGCRCLHAENGNRIADIA